MKLLHCMLSLLVCQQFTVSVEPILPVFTVDVEAAEKTSPPERKPVYFVLFATRSCSPCKRWQRDELPKIVAAGYQVIIVDVDQESQWGVSRVPEIWRCRRSTSTRIGAPFKGFTRAEKLLEAKE